MLASHACFIKKRNKQPSAYNSLKKQFSDFVIFPSHVNSLRNQKSPLIFFTVSIILQFSSLNSLRQISACLFKATKWSVARRIFSYFLFHIAKSSIRPINYLIKDCVNMPSSNLMSSR